MALDLDIASRGPQIRNPSNAAVRWRLSAGNGRGFSACLETVGLGCAIAAIAGALPLVMMLHQ